MSLFETTITIDAPAEVVFRHLTEAAGLLRWIAADATADPVPGGELRWTHHNGATMIGRFVEVTPNSRIVFRYGWEDNLLGLPPESTIVEIDLYEDEAETRLRLIHRDIPSTSLDDHGNGWNHFLAELARSCARQPRRAVTSGSSTSRRSLGSTPPATGAENLVVAEPDRQAFRDRRRAESFGSSAKLYDAARPSYPDELIAWLGESGRGIAADVGCGTGRVARLLAEAGWQVAGVEVDERMAEVARSHGIDVDVSSFELWHPEDRFDLIASGQAWHWIDPDVGFRRAAELLRPGGRLALFWNSYRYDIPTRAVFETALNRHAPELLTNSVPFGTASPDHVALDADTVRRSSQWFGEPEIRVFAHGRTQSADEWLADMRTHSPMAMLDPDIRVALLDDLRSSLAELNRGYLEVEYETRVTALRRR